MDFMVPVPTCREIHWRRNGGVNVRTNGRDSVPFVVQLGWKPIGHRERSPSARRVEALFSYAVDWFIDSEDCVHNMDLIGGARLRDCTDATAPDGIFANRLMGHTLLSLVFSQCFVGF